jgi:TRAP-type C4-dicarboxylate transport system substrate-binding protein
MSKFKKIALSSTVLAASFAAVLGASVQVASAETVLSYSPWLPETYPLNDAVLRPWMAEVEEVTEGRVSFNWLPKSVGKASDQFDVVHDGLADMSLILPGYTPGRFELIELGELPLLSSDVAKLGPNFYEIYSKHLEPLAPFEGAHVLSIWSTIPTQVVSGEGLIEDIEDFQGLKLRAPSATAGSIMEALGSVPVQKPVSEIYELASTGIIDGSFFPISTTYDFEVDGPLNYFTIVPGGLGQSVMTLLVNQDKWDAISEEDRTAIMAISGSEIAGAAGALFQEAESAAIRRTETERPTEISTASPELVAAISEKLIPIYEAWYAKAEANGLADPAAVLQEFREMLAE